MTESQPRRPRWTKSGVRVLAWLTGGVTFALSGAVLSATPKPKAELATKPLNQAPPRRVIERHVTRRVVIYDPPAVTGGSGATVVYVPGSSGSSGGSGSSTSGSSGSGSGGSSGSSQGSSGGGSSTPPSTTTGGSPT